MRILLTIVFILLFTYSFAQKPTHISGKIVDENGKAVYKAVIHYGNSTDDTAYTDKKGNFRIAYPNPQRFWYYLYVDRNDYLPKSFFIELSSTDIIIKKPFVLRSRKGFWYDSKKIDSTHLGITVKEAIEKYKLDIEMCQLWDEPPGKYFGFTTELSDSSYITLIFQGIFNKEKRLKMKDILDRKIIGIGISFMDGTERIFGNGFARENPYLIERQVRQLH